MPSVDALIKAGAKLNILNNPRHADQNKDYNTRRWASPCGAAGAAGRASAASDAAVARRNTPLHLAARYGHADVAAALIGAGADVSVENKDRWAVLVVVRPVWRGGPVPPPMLLLPAGTRRCTQLPAMATPM